MLGAKFEPLRIYPDTARGVQPIQQRHLLGCSPGGLATSRSRNEFQ